jgi:hypothetical protein
MRATAAKGGGTSEQQTRLSGADGWPVAFHRAYTDVTATRDQGARVALLVTYRAGRREHFAGCIHHFVINAFNNLYMRLLKELLRL